MTKKAVNVRRLLGKNAEHDHCGVAGRRSPMALLFEIDCCHKVRADAFSASYRAHGGDRRLRRRCVITAEKGALQGKRVVRGRNAQCRKLDGLGTRPLQPIFRQVASYAMPVVIALLTLPLAYGLTLPLGYTLTDVADGDKRGVQMAVTASLDATEDDGVVYIKSFTFKRASDLIDIAYDIDNQSDTPWRGFLYAQFLRSEVRPQRGFFLNGPQAVDAATSTASASVVEAPEKLAKSDDATDGSLPVTINRRWRVGTLKRAKPGPQTDMASDTNLHGETRQAARGSGEARGAQVESLPLKTGRVVAATPAPQSSNTALVRLLFPQAIEIGDGVRTPSPTATYQASPSELRETIPLSLETAFDEHRKSNPGIHFNPARHDSYWEMKLKSLVAGKTQITGQVAFSSFDPESEDGFEDDQYRGMRLGLQSSAGGFGYGTRYRSAGKNFEAKKKDKSKLKEDREIWEIWGSKRFGNFNLKTAFIQEQNNLQGDPKKPRLADQETRVTLSHALSNWPSLGYSFSYGTGTRASSDEPAGYAAFRGPMERLGASLYYSSDHWNASLNSYQITARDDQVGGRGSTMRGHSLSASYYPTQYFSISPYLGIRDEYYESDQSHTEGAYVGLALSQAIPHKRLRLDAYGSYYSDRNSTWDYDTDGVYAEAGPVWSLNRKPGGKPQSVGLYFTYSNYNDRVFPDSSSDDTAVWLIYKFNDGGLPFFRLDDFSPFR